MLRAEGTHGSTELISTRLKLSDLISWNLEAALVPSQVPRRAVSHQPVSHTYKCGAWMPSSLLRLF